MFEALLVSGAEPEERTEALEERKREGRIQLLFAVQLSVSLA